MKKIFNSSMSKCYVIDNMEQKINPNWTVGTLSESVLYRGTKSLYLSSIDKVGGTNLPMIPKTGTLSSLGITMNVNYKSGYRTFSILVFIDGNLTSDISNLYVKTSYESTSKELNIKIPKEYSRKWFILRWKNNDIVGTLKSIQFYSKTDDIEYPFYFKDLIVSNSEVIDPTSSKFVPDMEIIDAYPCGNLSVTPFIKEKWNMRADDGTIPNLYGSIIQETGNKPRDIGLTFWDRQQDITETSSDSLLFKTKHLLSKNVYYLTVDINGTWFPVKILGGEPSRKKTGKVHFVDLDTMEYTEIGEH